MFSLIKNEIAFKTKIYHPNIDEKGQVCLPIISAENWKPATKTDQVIQALVQLVNEPEPEHPLRAELLFFVRDELRGIASRGDTDVVPVKHRGFAVSGALLLVLENPGESV